ncbi:MAG: hypothetical protein NUV53_04635 [Patescibacteria group bacterium]|nr:hypothetical protein [Patescibacteria group bacterium]
MFALFTVIFGFIPYHAIGQTEPEVIINWKAQSYTPSSYFGKSLPISKTSIVASLEILQGGKFVDISKETIYWYVDNRLIFSGKGPQRVSFRAPEQLQGSLSLRVELPSYNGTSLIKAVTIPIVRPEVIIIAPSQEGKISLPSTTFTSAPYFFNITNPAELSFQWSINDEPAIPTGNPTMLTATIGGAGAVGSSLRIGLSVINPAYDFETAQSTITMTIR